MKNTTRCMAFAAALVLIVGCAGPAEEPAVEEAAPEATEHAAPHWGYGEDDGPARWAELSDEWALCGSGQSQSPIDLGVTTSGEVPDVSLEFPPVELQVVNQEHVLEATDNGHTIQVNYDGGHTLFVRDESYSLLQYHFHSPSEHTVNGEHYPMEMHLVHSNDSGDLVVVGVLITEGEHNEAFDTVWANLPKETGEVVTVEGVMVDIDELLPANTSSYRYYGSLTTPPCSEGVAWMVGVEPIEFDTDQIAAFRESFYGNNRPTQPLNDREVRTDLVEVSK